jgi:DNA damage-binding protein 1
MQAAGVMHLGEMVNVFRHGTLVGLAGADSALMNTPIMFGTVEGGLGLILRIDKPLYE